MAFNFKNLEEYYTSGKNRNDIIKPIPPGLDYSTINPVNPMAKTSEKATAILELYAGLNPGDRKPIFSSDVSPRINHLNNYESGFLELSPNPDERDGLSSFKFNTKLPRGGSSLQSFTRLRYNDYFARVKPEGRNGLQIPAGTVGNSPRLRMSDNQIENFKKKVGSNDFVDIRTEAERNNPRTPLWGKGPLVQRGLQRGKDNPKGTLEMINKLTAPIIDTARVAKYMISPDGLLFNIKQFGLQLSNPKKQFSQLGMPNADRIYNPLALALQVPLNSIGMHGDRHFLGQLNPREIQYERVITNIENLNPAKPGSDNRLIKLGQDMEVGLFEPSILKGAPALKGLMKLYTKFTSFLSRLGGKGGVPIPRLSGLAGPNSFFGIGQTTIYRSVSGIQRAPVFLYGPEEPYYKQRAAEHYDDGKISEASKGKDGEPGLEKLSDSLTIPTQTGQSAKDLWQNFPESKGEIYPGSGKKTFDVFGYTEINNFGRKPKTFRDFRKKDEDDSYDDNSVTKIKISDYGAIEPGKKENDDINYDIDYVKIRFNDDISLRAYITEITDKLSPSYSTISYAGNPVDAYMFDKISRAWSLGLQMPAFTSGELKNNYKILNDIMGYVSPKLYSHVGGGRIQELTVGSLWKKVPVIVDSFDYTINMDAGWDINLGEDKETTGHELPMLFEIKMGGKFLVNADGNTWQSEGEFFDKSIWA